MNATCKGCGAEVTHRITYSSGAEWFACEHCVEIDVAARESSIRLGLTDDYVTGFGPLTPALPAPTKES